MCRAEDSGIMGQQSQTSVFLILGNVALSQKEKKKKTAQHQHTSIAPLLKGGKCKDCKNSPENRLSGFLKELSWGSKQHGGSENAVMTDGISRAWHNSPI